MPDSFLYRIPDVGPRWTEHFPSGIYETQKELIVALRTFRERHGLPSGLQIHVYKTDGTSLSVGRKYLGSVGAASVLAAGKIDMTRVQG